ncbi:MAG: hypothetical protein ACR2PT_23175 [Endozoicomonas sp.]
MGPIMLFARKPYIGERTPQECNWIICGRTYKCDLKKLTDSGLTTRYLPVEYIDGGGYATIYEVQDKRDLSYWAIKVVNKKGDYGYKFPNDIKNFEKTKDETSVIQSRESFDLGKTGVIVVEWADADMSYRHHIFSDIKTDRQFRLLAKQMLECIDTLDKKGLYHPTITENDFLYVKQSGRVKVSALERAFERDVFKNTAALKVVYNVLYRISTQVDDLGVRSQRVLSKLKNMENWETLKKLVILEVETPERLKEIETTTAGSLLKHMAFTAFSADMTLDL